MVENIEFKDDSDFSPVEKTLSIKEITLRHIKKISDICCKEFRGGYWEKRPIQTNGGIIFMEIYHEDVREAYCNSIDFLMDLVYPLSDKLLKEYLQKNEGYDEEGYDIEEKEVDIKQKLNLKRRTFRQIHLMFERTNFWKGNASYNE